VIRIAPFLPDINPWGFRAKDRSGRLAQVEEPHLGRLMAKIRTPASPGTRTG